ncbi:MAG: hypothetical protein AAF581_08970 [Planctomycetota bacterium]
MRMLLKSCLGCFLAVALLASDDGVRVDPLTGAQIDVGTVDIFMRFANTSVRIGVAGSARSDDFVEAWALMDGEDFPLQKTYQVKRVSRSSIRDLEGHLTSYYGTVMSGRGGYFAPAVISNGRTEPNKHLCAFELRDLIGDDCPGATFGYYVLRASTEAPYTYCEMWCVPGCVGFPVQGSFYAEKMSVDPFKDVAWGDLAEMMHNAVGWSHAPVVERVEFRKIDPRPIDP